MRGWLLLLGAIVALSSSDEANAQGWTLDLAAGGARYRALTAAVETSNAILGVRYDGVQWLYLAAGTPLEGPGQPWAAGGTGRRLSFAAGPRLDAGIDLAAHGYGYRDRALDASGMGATLEALPFLSATSMRTRMEAYSGLRHHATRFAGERTTRSVHESGVRFRFAPTLPLALTAEGRHVRAEEGAYSFLGAGTEARVGPGVLWGFAGHWLSGALESPVWGGGVAAALGRGLEVRLSFERPGRDPLFWSGPRRLWSVGVSRALGRRASPAPPLLPRVEGGHVTIRLPLAEADRPPALAGDFTGWEPVVMTRSGDAWTATLPVPSGVHRYAFRRADGTWFVPAWMPGRTDDGFGGVSAILIVP